MEKLCLMFLLTILVSGCSSLYVADKSDSLSATETEQFSATVKPVTKKHDLPAEPQYDPARCYKLVDQYGFWGATSKVLTGLAALSPAGNLTIAMTGGFGAGALGTSFYADNRIEEAVAENCPVGSKVKFLEKK